MFFSCQSPRPRINQWTQIARTGRVYQGYTGTVVDKYFFGWITIKDAKNQRDFLKIGVSPPKRQKTLHSYLLHPIFSLCFHRATKRPPIVFHAKSAYSPAQAGTQRGAGHRVPPPLVFFSLPPSHFLLPLLCILAYFSPSVSRFSCIGAPTG